MQTTKLAIFFNRMVFHKLMAFDWDFGRRNWSGIFEEIKRSKIKVFQNQNDISCYQSIRSLMQAKNQIFNYNTFVQVENFR